MLKVQVTKARNRDKGAMLLNPRHIISVEPQAGGESLIRLVDGESLTVAGTIDDILAQIESWISSVATVAPEEEEPKKTEGSSKKEKPSKA